VIQELKAAGEDYDTASDERLETLYSESEAEVANLSAEEIETRLKELADQQPPDENLVNEDLADDELAADDSVDEELSDDTADDSAPPPDEVALPEEEGMFGALLGVLFTPMDGLFILLAFFTAYKVGSGEMGD
jgi:hypothetical protein